jgi:glycosyltransferase involved in cell wall biosynthesis
MNPPSPARFVVATPARTVCDDNARALERHDLLRFIALGTRRGTAGIPPEHTRLNPAIGAATYVFGRFLSTYWGEHFRFHLHPWFDRWVRSQLTPGDHVISSYGYANESFRWARAHGGRTFLDGGNSHPQNFWAIVSEEHRRWNCPYPPVGPHHYRRSLAMMEHVDFVLSPSSFVTQSFLTRGFRPEQILRNVYPLDLACFAPTLEPRPAERPLTVISTGSLTLRKGSPYLLEAFRLVLRSEPRARLLLTSAVGDSMLPVMEKYRALPIDWASPLPHPQLAARLRSADVFVLPSLEDGFARTVAEALACGLPVITTPNTGASDLIRPGENGEVVPIRDPQAIADAVLRWGARIGSGSWQPRSLVDSTLLSVDSFEREFLRQLAALGLVPAET